MSKLYEGGCLCGSIRFRATEGPTRCMICYCEDCRRHSGAPCLSFVHFPAASFRWSGAQPKRYRSSTYAERGFCPQCGSTVAMYEEVLEGFVQIALGSLDDPHDIQPDDHVWVGSKIRWFEVKDGLPRFEKNSNAGPSKAEGIDPEAKPLPSER